MKKVNSQSSEQPSRLECNRLILKQLSIEIERNPDLRFHQLLQNLDITPLVMVDAKEVDAVRVVPDLFYEESAITASRIFYDEKIAKEFENSQNNTYTIETHLKQHGRSEEKIQ